MTMMDTIVREGKTERRIRALDATDIVQEIHGLEDERDALAARLAEAERALREICAVDKAAPGRKDCHIWADMLAIASAAAYGRDSFMSLNELTDSASVVQYKPCEICTTQSWCETHGCQCYPTEAMCCLDYPRCDCNSPPEPDNEWHCSQYPDCECFAGCREKALEAFEERAASTVTQDAAP